MNREVVTLPEIDNFSAQTQDLGQENTVGTCQANDVDTLQPKGYCSLKKDWVHDDDHATA